MNSKEEFNLNLLNSNRGDVCCQMNCPPDSGLKFSKVLRNCKLGGPAQSDRPVGDGLLEEAVGDVEVVEVGDVLHEAVDVVSDSQVTIVVFLKSF